MKEVIYRIINNNLLNFYVVGGLEMNKVWFLFSRSLKYSIENIVCFYIIWIKVERARSWFIG